MPRLEKFSGYGSVDHINFRYFKKGCEFIIHKAILKELCLGYW